MTEKKPGAQEAEEIVRKARQKQDAQQHPQRSALYGLGMFGLVGWAVAVPVVLGVALGLWIDGQVQSRVSWTLTLLLAGAVLGCLNAWYWVQREGSGE